MENAMTPNSQSSLPLVAKLGLIGALGAAVIYAARQRRRMNRRALRIGESFGGSSGFGSSCVFGFALFERVADEITGGHPGDARCSRNERPD